MSGDRCKATTILVQVQENGWIRNQKGRIIAMLVDDVDFECEHIIPYVEQKISNDAEEKLE